ncbi:O-antigen ligase family protein [Stieleria varia]|uniref:O-Antigen ligase n=1 Tax=Stieleria varia TaxID=2528005 RepID=A0A5C6AGA9_9BACT|nr:O-antigen ligase family protein [Stieleria varia]TWT98639.1 O-Antigen ligase [Stieleria varia]
METLLRLSITVAAWVAVVMVALLPIGLGFDFGGVLWWSHHALALVVIASACLTLGTLWSHPKLTLRHQLVMVPLGLWIAYSWLHRCSFDASFVGWLSQGTAAAYQDWMQPLLGAGSDLSRLPMSIAPDYTRHATCVFVLLLPLAWLSGRLFSTSSRIVFVLHAISIGVSLHVLYGITCLIHPEWSIRPANEMGIETGFGAFVNRNNAALYFNLAIACSLGVIGWRLATVIGQQVDEDDFEIADLLVLFNDFQSLVAVGSLLVCCLGILTCGSRAGIVSAFAGLLIVFGIMRGRKGIFRWVAIFLATFLLGAILFLPVGGRGSTTLDRLRDIDLNSGEGVIDDSRWSHWGDSIDTGLAHLPAGAGLSTYAWAYLPYQNTGSRAWFHHAENIWLELFVEQGIPGVLLVVVIIGMIIHSLRKLNENVDPVDQGIRTAGWFAVGVIGISQIADFGLIIPANFTIVVVLFGIVCTRAAFGTTQSEPEVDETILFRSDRKTSIGRTAWSSMIVGVLAILSAALCVPTLRDDATDQALVRSAALTLQSSYYDSGRVRRGYAAVEERLAQRETYELLIASADLSRQSARLNEVFEREPEGSSEITSAYENTRTSKYRRAWRHPDESEHAVSDAEIERYRPALERVERALQRLPLGVEPRAKLVYLDFVHQDVRLTRAALQQLGEFQHHSPEQLIQIAEWAAGGDDYDLAAQLWKRATLLQPRRARFAVEFVRRYPKLSLLECIDDNSVAQQVAVKLLLATAADDEVLRQKATEFLQQADGKLHCNQCETISEGASCYELAADLQSYLGNGESALEHLESAVKRDPSNSLLKSKWIARLREMGYHRQALQEARRSRTQMTDTATFDKMIKEMAEEDLKEVESSKKAER